MSSFLSITGMITQIQPEITNSSEFGCSLIATLQTLPQGIVTFRMTGDTYVVDNMPLQAGDTAVFFYDANAPVPLIYPPRYLAAAAAAANRNLYYMGTFSNRLISDDQMMRLNTDMQLPLFLPNGQPFSGSIAGKTVLVEYQSSTRSIPALVSPSRIIVFCYK